ncbi:MAG: hypothetical protein L6276_05265 [Acetobacterium sp.]|nr:hypothetical protein [Bacillota bacterium]MCG2729678.1 hypothetical protein [Acetobacterium sp.]
MTGTENLPQGASIKYNVHVQNIGWLASTDLTKTADWIQNGDFAGS